MKRRSLVGPILLLLFGTLLLAINLRPELVSLEMISKYWPFLLIGWGVLRLVEILFWRLTGKPLPAFGISGGEWVLVVLICLVGSGFSFAYRHGPRLPSLATRISDIRYVANAANIKNTDMLVIISSKTP